MKKKRVVVKIGSSILSAKGLLDEKFFDSIASQVSKLDKKNIEVCIVSSGAILAGISILGLSKVPQKINQLQAIASIGQGLLMNTYTRLFKKYKKLCAQVLLTWDDFQHRGRYLNAKHTLVALFERGVVPVVNENDTVSVDEIKFGDNDKLSALVAGLIDADVLLMLSDVEGFDYQGNIMAEITELEHRHLKAARKKHTLHTKGGMLSKLVAADLAATFGIKTVIANGRKKDIIKKIVLDNADVGTCFLPKRRLAGKKRWLAFSRKSKGALIVDKGAEKALVEKYSSLLSRGIKAIEGDFVRGDTVDIISENNIILGRGLVNYNSEYLRKNVSTKLPCEVIHRDHLVITKSLTLASY